MFISLVVSPLTSLIGSESEPIILLKDELGPPPVIVKIAFSSVLLTKSESLTLLKITLSALLTAKTLPLQPSKITVLFSFLKSSSVNLPSSGSCPVTLTKPP